MKKTIRLDRLAEALGVPYPTAARWAANGLARVEYRGVGRGNFMRMDRPAAVEFIAVAVLRRYGVSRQKIARLAREMRDRGAEGSDLLALGTDGGAILMDGAGDDAPLRDPSTGQAVLFARVDLRRLRADAVKLLDDLEAEALAKAIALRASRASVRRTFVARSRFIRASTR